ncbi:hypothetical protein [Halorubellus salinus]|uniref:hypothetical protein n=1 Tax=Halorubellus salinus TaxID=755309 RepID=UPI001D096005|nr:hypothetical protein [Halorubellus salinus]
MTHRLVPVMAAVAVLALVVVGPAPATGAHPPVPLCGGCTGGFEDAAADHGANATVERSELALHFHANGTATGVARLRVDERAADRFRENATLLDAVARDAFVTPERSERSLWAGSAVIRDVERVRAGIDARTVTVRFALDDATRDGYGGVVYTDLFRRNGTVGGIDLQVDQATVLGPDDHVIVRAPDGWGGDAIRFEPMDDSLFVGYGGYVAWAPDAGAASDVSAAASIWTAEASTEVPRVLSTSWLASVLAAALAGLFALVAHRFEDGDWSSPAWLAVGYVATAVASLAATYMALAWFSFGGLGVTLLAVVPGVVVAALVTAALALASRRGRRPLARVPTVFLYLLPVLAVGVFAVGIAAAGTAALWAASTTVLLVGALGVATTRGAGPTVAVAVAFALAPVCLAFPTLSPSNFAPPFGLAWVLAVALVGVPLFALGRRRGGTAQNGEAERSASTAD